MGSSPFIRTIKAGCPSGDLLLSYEQTKGFEGARCQKMFEIFFAKAIYKRGNLWYNKDRQLVIYKGEKGYGKICYEKDPFGRV